MLISDRIFTGRSYILDYKEIKKINRYCKKTGLPLKKKEIDQD
jgi:hypothetical protein